MDNLSNALDEAFYNLQKPKRLTMDDCLPCPVCEEEMIVFVKLTQYRPKEAIGKCTDCEYSLPIKGNHEHKLVSTWNNTYFKIKQKKGF